MENNISDMNEKLGVPVNLASCHTGVVSGKFVEGHVPVTQIAELSRRANLDGIAAFGMPWDRSEWSQVTDAAPTR